MVDEHAVRRSDSVNYDRFALEGFRGCQDLVARRVMQMKWFISLLCLCSVHPCEQAYAQEARPVYRCPGPPVVYTDKISAAEARTRNCRGIDGKPLITPEQGSSTSAAAADDFRKRQELEERLAAEARERERLQAQIQPSPQPPRPQAALRPERRVALLVGNAAYQISPLDNPVNDATDVDAGMKRAGFQTTLLRNATLAQMREATRRFADQLTTADVALIYFAGHGIESRGRNYMVPVNADLKFEHELLDQAFDANQWLEMLEGIRSANADRVNIVILDACRNNNLVGARSLSRGLGRLDAPSGTFLAYSTAPGKVAADGPRGQRNSPFTKHLLQAMQQPNQPIEEVFKEVRRNVSRETAGAQVPWESTSLTGFFSFRPER
jgi:hypothetical protein